MTPGKETLREVEAIRERLYKSRRVGSVTGLKGSTWEDSIAFLLSLADRLAAQAQEIKALREGLDEAVEALEENLALNINWTEDAEPETLAYYSEYKPVIKRGRATLAKLRTLAPAPEEP